MKKLFLALPFLLAGCQSERVAFQFQPVAPTKSVVLMDHPAAAAPVSAAVAAAAATAAAARQNQPKTARFANKLLAGRHSGAPAVPERVAPEPAAWASEAATTRPHPVRPLALRQLVRQRATAGPARTTENGLGGIALFFIGVALALLAGLGALVSVIFGTSFFTGVGFAAAGLLVLFLLYSLLSGGKKKGK